MRLTRPKHARLRGSPLGNSQGYHRTGTTGDDAGALWLSREVAGLGVEVTTEVFEVNRLDPVACYLQLDGERISGVPAFDALPTGAHGVTSALSLSGHEEAILVAKLSPQSVYSGEYDKLRRETPYRALVIVCTGARPGMGLPNAERFRNPYGSPAIHVSSEASALVLAGAARVAPARVVAESEYLAVTARNVIVVIRGAALFASTGGYDAA